MNGKHCLIETLFPISRLPKLGRLQLRVFAHATNVSVVDGVCQRMQHVAAIKALGLRQRRWQNNMEITLYSI
jgi:hypothetical protein